MNYTDLIISFEKWVKINKIPNLSQLLYYKIISIFNDNNWEQWLHISNFELMKSTNIPSEKTLIKHRNNLLENNLLEFRRGTKSRPNQYKISTINFNNLK